MPGYEGSHSMCVCGWTLFSNASCKRLKARNGTAVLVCDPTSQARKWIQLPVTSCSTTAPYDTDHERALDYEHSKQTCVDENSDPDPESDSDPESNSDSDPESSESDSDDDSQGQPKGNRSARGLRCLATVCLIGLLAMLFLCQRESQHFDRCSDYFRTGSDYFRTGSDYFRSGSGYFRSGSGYFRANLARALEEYQQIVVDVYTASLPSVQSAFITSRQFITSVVAVRNAE